MHELNVPLANRTRPACITAIGELTALLASDDLSQRFPDELIFVFVLPDGTEIAALQFFGLVESQGPASVPALRRLMETALDNPYAEVWAENGPFLQNAMKALVVLDPDALDTLKRYPLDLFHNEYPGERTFPAMIKAHGWNDERVAFILDRVVFGYLGYEWSVDMWRKHRLSEALAQRYTPTEFVVSRKIDDVPDDDDLVEFIQGISPLNAWEREVFLLMGADLAGADIPYEVGPDGRDHIAERAKSSDEGRAIRNFRQALQGEIILEENAPGPPRQTTWFTQFNLLAALAGASSGAFWAWHTGASSPAVVAIQVLGTALLAFAVAVAFDKGNALVEHWVEDGREAAIRKLYAANIRRTGFFTVMATACVMVAMYRWEALSTFALVFWVVSALCIAFPVLRDSSSADASIRSLTRARLCHAALMVVVTGSAYSAAMVASPMLASSLSNGLFFGLGPQKLAHVACLLGCIGVVGAVNEALARLAAPRAARNDMLTWPVAGIYAGAALRDLRSSR